MKNKDFLNLIKFESEEIDHYFRKASIEGRGTSQEVSDRREVALHKFLQKFFPFPYRIAKGNIIDSFEKRSNSIDALILNPVHPHTVSSDNKHSIIFADGVDAAIELKPDLNSEKEIIRALEQIRSVKELRRRKEGVLAGFEEEYSLEYLETIRQIPGIIFCNKTYSDLNILFQTIGDFYIQNKITSRGQFDMIVINNRGIVYNSGHNRYVDFPKGDRGLYYKSYNHQTLAVFLMWLNKFPQSEIRIGEPVLKYYFEEDVQIAETDEKLNKRLIDLE